MVVTVKFRGKELQVKAGTRVEDAIRSMGLSLEGVVARVNDSIVTEDYRLKDGETLLIISAISGG